MGESKTLYFVIACYVAHKLGQLWGDYDWAEMERKRASERVDFLFLDRPKQLKGGEGAGDGDGKGKGGGGRV